MNRFNGKTVIVTGSSSGIGEATARRFAGEGANVVLNSRRREGLEKLATELDRWRLDARTVNLMVGGPEGLAPEVCARAEQRWSLSPLTLDVTPTVTAWITPLLR